MHKKAVTKFISLSVIFLILVGCSSEPKTQKVNLTAEDIKWDLSEINAEVGQTVEITITNGGALDHNFVIEDLGIAIELAPGGSEVVTFVVTEAGTLEFICNVPGHQEAGMVGTITINP